ncbi:MAG: helix-turn-helix domain-containing protein [Sciscionella sp.]
MGVRFEVKENHKLLPDEVTELVSAYQAGVSIVALARQFRVHEQTVKKHLSRQGVALRPVRKLTEVQELEIVHLYAEGWSAERIGERLGVGQMTVLKRIRERGVTVRGPHDRRRRRSGASE